MPEFTLIHVGDIHGHLMPRPNVQDGASGQLEGGLARVATLVRRIRAQRPSSLLVNTGDTVQGSAEALFTRGQALVDVVDLLGPDLYAPGNWDYVYGKDRFLELFGDGTGPGGAGHRWGALAANVYDEGSGELLLPATRVVDVGGVRVGVVGLSSERAINALGTWVTEGITFTADAAEIPGHVTALREEQRADVVVLISEFGVAKNLLIAEQNPGIDVVLSSDMHEETRQCVVTSTGALVSEVGQDGTRVAQLDLRVEEGRVTGWNYRLHTVDADLPDDPAVADVIARVRAPFVSGPGFRPHTNPINGALLDRPIDTVVGHTEVALHRSDPCDGTRPAVVSGTSHDFLSAAFRAAAAADVGHVRGFRYGTHVPPGPVRLEDLYHYLPVGAELAQARVSGEQLLRHLQSSSDGTFDPDPFRWTGGWVHAHAGVRYALHVRAPRGETVSQVEVQRADTGEWTALDPGGSYTMAGYWYAPAPEIVGGLSATDVEVLRGDDGRPRDATEHVVDHLATEVVRGEAPRIRLVHPLPRRIGPNPEIQPWRGGRGGAAQEDDSGS